MLSARSRRFWWGSTDIELKEPKPSAEHASWGCSVTQKLPSKKSTLTGPPPPTYLTCPSPYYPPRQMNKPKISKADPAHIRSRRRKRCGCPYSKGQVINRSIEAQGNVIDGGGNDNIP